jgi:hypothetical protein
MTVLDFKPKSNNNTDSDDQDYVSGDMRCLGCNFEWQASYPAGGREVQCPRCYSMKGYNKLLIVPPDGIIYRCKCDNDLFFITPHGGPLCPQCGTYHRPYDNPKGAA